MLLCTVSARATLAWVTRRFGGRRTIVWCSYEVESPVRTARVMGDGLARGPVDCSGSGPCIPRGEALASATTRSSSAASGLSLIDRYPTPALPGHHIWVAPFRPLGRGRLKVERGGRGLSAAAHTSSACACLDLGELRA